MTAPIRITPEYEIYRVVSDYEGLQDGFLDRIEDLNTTLEQIEAAGGIPHGHASRMLCKSDKRVVKAMGPKSLQQMLKGTGLVLALVVDDERFAPLKAEMTQRLRPRKLANASSVRPAWLFTKKKAREMGIKRWSTMPDAKRKRLMRKAGKASGRARRMRLKPAKPIIVPEGMANA
jgi:hypothetical protein